MLKRKVETYLAKWKESEDRKPLVIKGIRQCGKTYIVQKFARENYESVVYMNFILEPDKKHLNAIRNRRKKKKRNRNFFWN